MTKRKKKKQQGMGGCVWSLLLIALFIITLLLGAGSLAIETDNSTNHFNADTIFISK